METVPEKKSKRTVTVNGIKVRVTKFSDGTTMVSMSTDTERIPTDVFVNFDNSGLPTMASFWDKENRKWIDTVDAGEQREFYKTICILTE